MKRRTKKDSCERKETAGHLPVNQLQEIEEEPQPEEPAKARSKRRGRRKPEPIANLNANKNAIKPEEEEVQIVSQPKQSTQASTKAAEEQNPKEANFGGSDEKKAEKATSRVSDDVRITFPYECKGLIRQAKQQAVSALSQMAEELERQSSELSPPLDDIEHEKVKKIFRRLKYFVKEVFAKMSEIAVFEKIYEVKPEIKVNELNEQLHTESGRLFQTLSDLLGRILDKKKAIEQGFSREIELQLESSLAIQDLNEDKNDFKIKCSKHTLLFDVFLDKFLQTQRDYFSTVQTSAKMLEDNFDRLKIESIKRFKEMTKKHSDLEKISELALENKTTTEKLLFD